MDEADPAADAGLGVQALLGLAAGSNVRLPSLANFGALQQGNPPSLLTHAPSSSASEHGLFGDRAAAVSAAVAANPLDARVVRHHQGPPALPARAARDTAHEERPPRGKDNASTPRLPSVPPAQRTDRNDPISTSAAPSANATPSMPVPRLASISEWAPSGTSSLLGPVPALPRLQHPHQIHGVPSLPSLPQPQPERPPTHSWAGQPIHAMLPQFPAPAVRQEWPSPPPLLYSFPPTHVPPVQSEVPPYYYGGSSSSHYGHHAPSLSQLHAQPPPLHIPQYVAGRSQLEQQRDSQSDSQGVNRSLPPILNGLVKTSSEESSTRRSTELASALLSVAGLETKNPPLPARSAPAMNGDVVKSKPMRKSVYVGSAAGRGLVDLMNPTDTLAVVAEAVVAEAVGPLAQNTVPASSSPLKEKAVSALALDLFGSGTKVPRSEPGRLSPVRRRKNGEKRDVASSCVRSQSTHNSVSSPEGNEGVAEKENKLRHNAKESSKSAWQTRDGVTEKRVVSPVKVTSPKTRSPTSDAQRLSLPGEGRSEDENPQKSAVSASDRDATPVPNESEGASSSESSDSEITRCPCGSAAYSGTMIACDECNTWQHRICMGFRRKSDVPRMYYCHICKPEEMRPNCVAHPRFKERQMAKDKDDQCEPILLSVKPLELRKLFSADLKAKQNGTRPLVFPDVFLKYAALYRTQFGKDRQSVVEGLVVLTEIPRSEVLEGLERAIKKSKMTKVSSADGADSHSVERVEKRRQHHTGSVSAPVANGYLSHTRSSGLKRSRPSPSTPENLQDQSDRTKPCTTPVSPGKEPTAREAARLSREERKVKQVMDIFARLEDRERDKKKPRLGEGSGSPRIASVLSPRPNSVNSGPRVSFSVKSPLRLSQSPEPSRVRSPLSPGDEKQKLPTSEKSVFSVASPVQPLATSPQPLVPAKRERTKERKESRRREGRAASALASGDAGRRNGIMPRRKERQVLSSVSVRQRKSTKSELAAISASLGTDASSRLHIPGPSVLGSGLIPRVHRSAADISASEKDLKEARAKSLGTSERLEKKAWLLLGAPGGPALSTSPRPVSYPVRKRLNRRPAANYVSEKGPMSELSLPSLASPASKTESLGVSMVVVSKRESLPDGGKGLEKFLAPGDMPKEESVLPTVADDSLSRSVFTVKKRARLRGYVPKDEMAGKGAADDKRGVKVEFRPLSFAFKKRPMRHLKLQVPKVVKKPVKSDPSIVSGSSEPAPDAEFQESVASNENSPCSSGSSGAVKAEKLDDDGKVPLEKKELVPLEKPSSTPKVEKTIAAAATPKVRTPPALPSTVFFSGMRRKSPSPPPSLPKTVFVNRGSPPPLPRPAFARDVSESSVVGKNSVNGVAVRYSKSASPPLRSPKTSSGRPDQMLSLPKPGLISIPRSVRASPPPLRSAALPKDTGLRSAKPQQAVVRSAAISIPRSMRTPPPLRSVPRPAVQPSTSSNSGVATVAHSLKASPGLRSVPSGRVSLSIDIPVTEETTASDVLQLRLQGFLNQNSMGKEPVSPRLSKRTPIGSPRSKVSTPVTQFGRNGVSNPWRSVDGIGPVKRVHGPTGASLTPSPPTSARLNTKRGSERSTSRNLGIIVGPVNGKSPRSSADEKAGTTPWRSYRQQNGWAQKGATASSKHAPHTASVPSAPSQENNKKANGSNGRRRPYS